MCGNIGWGEYSSYRSTSTEEKLLWERFAPIWLLSLAGGVHKDLWNAGWTNTWWLERGDMQFHSSTRTVPPISPGLLHMVNWIVADDRSLTESALLFAWGNWKGPFFTWGYTRGQQHCESYPLCDRDWSCGCPRSPMCSRWTASAVRIKAFIPLAFPGICIKSATRCFGGAPADHELFL